MHLNSTAKRICLSVSQRSPCASSLSVYSLPCMIQSTVEYLHFDYDDTYRWQMSMKANFV